MAAQSKFIKARYLVFAGALLITLAGSLFVLRDFRIDNSVGIWFAQDDPALVDYQQYLDDFGHTEWTLLMVETESLAAPAFLKDLRALTIRLARLDHVERVVSLVNAPGSLTSPPSDLLRRDDLQRLAQSPFARKVLMRPGDQRRTLLLLQTANDLSKQDPYRLALVDSIHAAVAAYPSISRHSLAGTPVINAELNRSAKTDMFVFFALVTLLVFVVSLIMFRSVKDASVVLTVSAGSVTFSMGLIVAVGYSLNMVTIMLPTVLIALSVAGTIHVIHTFHRIRREEGAERAVSQTIRRVWLPCLGTSITTIVGFMSLSGSSVLPIFQLAVFGSCGVAMALLLSLTVAPLMLFHFWRSAGRDSGRSAAGHSGLLSTLVRWLRLRPASIALVFVVSSALLAGLWSLDADTNYAEFFRSNSTVPRDYGRIESAGFPQSPLVLTLKAPGDAQRLGSNLWTTLPTFAQELRQLPGVKVVISPTARGPDPLALVSRDRRQCRLLLLTDYLSSDALHRVMVTIRGLKAAIISTGAALTITGTTVLWASMDTQLIHTQVYSAFVVSAALLLVLTLLFRSFSLALVGWLVSAFPVALILGVMGIVGVRINMATVLIAGISLGIAVDDTIHFIFTFRHKLRSGSDAKGATEQVLFETGPRLVITSAILIGGFLSMVVSSFLPTANFGLFACLTILVALICDLLLLPLLLRQWACIGQSHRLRRLRVTAPLATERRC